MDAQACGRHYLGCALPTFKPAPGSIGSDMPSESAIATAETRNIWQPDVTVATIVVRDGALLMVGGLSFLSKLKRFEYAGGTMVLEQ